MNTLDIARQGKSAARQLRSMLNAKVVITEAELSRLLTKIEDGFDQMMPAAPPPSLPADMARGFAPIVHDGGRP